MALEEQRAPGSFAQALHHRAEVLDLPAFDAHDCNDDNRVTAHAPELLLKAVLPGYSRGIISSRSIERSVIRAKQSQRVLKVRGRNCDAFAALMYWPPQVVRCRRLKEDLHKSQTRHDLCRGKFQRV